MSQHFLKTSHGDQAITILAGWDRPLQGYFMVIELDGCTNEYEDPCYLYNNLDHHVSHPPTFAPFQEVLDAFGIHVPEEMVREIIADGMVNMGNKHVEHLVGENGLYQRVQKY